MNDLTWIRTNYAELVKQYSQKWIIVWNLEVYGVYDEKPLTIPTGSTLLFVKDKK